MKRLTIAIMLVISALLISACSDENVENMLFFYSCEARSELGISRQKVVMPESGFELIANKREFMSSADLERVDVAKIVLPDGKPVTGFLFECNEKGTKKLYRETASNMGGWILLRENTTPIALRKIDTIIQDGKLFMVLEFPEDTDLFQKVDAYNKDIQIIAPKVREREESLW